MAESCSLLNFMARKDLDGGTNVEDHLPWCFNHFVKIELGMIDIDLSP